MCGVYISWVALKLQWWPGESTCLHGVYISVGEMDSSIEKPTIVSSNVIFW